MKKKNNKEKRRINIKYRNYIFKALPGSVECWNCALDNECWDDPDHAPCPNRIWKNETVYYAFANLSVKIRIPRKLKKQLKKQLGLKGKVGNRGIVKHLYLCGGL